MAGVLATTPLDRQIAHILFFDEAHSRWLGTGTWWANALIHKGGAWLVRILMVSALALWVTTYIKPRVAAWRRPALYFAVSTLLGVGLVGLLKALTNVDCPWDLTEFGGRFPFIDLFEHRPTAWRRAQCFPSGHASAGYALLALYFTFRERSRRAAQLGWLAGLAMGLIFGLAQQSRGAHFLSHDVWSAMLVWTAELALYTFAFKARLWDRSQWDSNEAGTAASRLPDGGTCGLPPGARPVAGA